MQQENLFITVVVIIMEYTSDYYEYESAYIINVDEIRINDVQCCL